MRTFQMPSDISEKEKIFGGIFTLAQGLWIVLGAFLGGITLLLTFKIFSWFSIIFVIIDIVIGLMFAIKKVKQLTLFSYIRYRIKYIKKTKKLPNTRSY